MLDIGLVLVRTLVDLVVVDQEPLHPIHNQQESFLEKQQLRVIKLIQEHREASPTTEMQVEMVVVILLTVLICPVEAVVVLVLLVMMVDPTPPHLTVVMDNHSHNLHIH